MLTIPQSVADEMRRHAAAEYPEECCGVLLGRVRGEECVGTAALACRNVRAGSGTRYAIAPEELIAAQRTARERGLAIVGFYHSHPDHAAEPSATDRAEAAWPEAIYVIVSVTASGAREIKAFRLAKPEDRTLGPENIVVQVTPD